MEPTKMDLLSPRSILFLGLLYGKLDEKSSLYTTLSFFTFDYVSVIYDFSLLMQNKQHDILLFMFSFFFSIKLHMTHNKKLKNVYNIWCNITYSYLSSYCFQVCRTYRNVDTSPDILKFSYFRHHLHVWKKLYLLTLIFFPSFSYLYNMKTHHHIQFTFLSTSAKFYIE